MAVKGEKKPAIPASVICRSMGSGVYYLMSMWNVILDVAEKAWATGAQMSPYLLLGFVVAGVFSLVFSPAFILKHFGQGKFSAILKAALLGVPLPICSCGVIPLATSLRMHGAGKGATAAFLMSTPQTGVDSIVVTYGMMGWLFALFRPLAALLSGITCGVIVEWADGQNGAPPQPETEATNGNAMPRWKKALRHAFVKLPRDIGMPVLAGLLVSGLLAALVPENYFANKLGQGILPMLVILGLSIPIYVCSTASVPVALALIGAGVSPGAALVFLMAGPAANAATLGAIWRVLGGRALAVYLGTLAACALAAGWVMDLLAPVIGVAINAPCHVDALGWTGHVWAILLLGLITGALLTRPRRKK